MKPLWLLWRDTVVSTVGLLLLVGVVVFLVDGVEQARQLATGAASADEWMRQVWARLPGQILAGLPVVGAVAAAQVASWWSSTGRVVSWQLVGRSPSWLAATSAAAVLFVALVASGAREVAAPWAALVLAGQDRWVAFDGDGEWSDLKMVRAKRLWGDRFEDVSVAWVREGQVVGRGGAAAGQWDGQAWTLSDASARVWEGGAPRAQALVLPPPALWRQQAVEVGMDASWRALRDAPNSPARSAWIAERAVTPIASGLLAALSVLLVLRFERWGFAVALVGAGVWRVGHIGVVALCARSVVPDWVGSLGVLAVLVVAILATSVRVPSARFTSR